MMTQMRLFKENSERSLVKIELDQEIEAIDIDKDLDDLSLMDLIPQGAVLALTRNYAPKAIRVGRILNLLAGCKSEGSILTRDEIGNHLSMTYAITQGTINVMRRLELINSRNQITSLGALINKYSPYLDDNGLLWFLHYALASNAQLVIWSHLFNHIFLNREEITINVAAEEYNPIIGRWSEQSIQKKVPKEVGAIFRAYTEDLFSSLRLITKEDKGLYFLNGGSELIPPLILLGIIHLYRDRYYQGASALELQFIVRGNFSPGRMVRASEASIRAKLDELHRSN